MVHWCPNCGNHLTVQRSQLTTSEVPEDDEYGYSFICRTCPYEFIVDKEYYNRRLSRVKLVDDIMGGASAWENVDQTAVPMCQNKQCGSTKAYYRQMQIRSADEPMTTFYKCVDCGTQWREN